MYGKTLRMKLFYYILGYLDFKLITQRQKYIHEEIHVSPISYMY